MKSRENIAEAIKNYLDKLGWTYDYAEDGDGCFDTGVGLENHENGAMIHIVVGNRAYTVMVVPALEGFTEAQMEDIKDFVAVVNAHMLMGTLVLNTTEQMLYVQLSQLCSGQLPDAETLEDTIMLPITIADDMMPSLLKMLAGKLTPEEAAIRFLTANEE